MLKTIKKISYIFITLFLLAVVFILIADKFDLSVGTAIVPIFFTIFILTLSGILLVSIFGIHKTISKNGKGNFCKEFLNKWLWSFLVLLVVAFLKKDVDILIVLVASLAISLFSYYYAAK